MAQQNRTQLRPLAYLDFGVDYLTCSYNDTVDGTRLSFFLNRIIASEQKEGNFLKKWGFNGYLGHQVGGLEFGTRHDGLLVKLSGPTAQRWWRRLGYMSTNCSRIDLQETFQYETDPRRVVERQFKRMRRLWSTKKRWPEPKMISGAMGGQTVYSGERVSDVFLRCYHRGDRKGCEDAMGHVRYEVELKNDRARQTLNWLVHMRKIEGAVRAECAQWFAVRGAWYPESLSAPCLYRHSRRLDDAQRRLAWLHAAVKPSVQRLLEAGYLNEVQEALGLSTLLRGHPSQSQPKE